MNDLRRKIIQKQKLNKANREITELIYNTIADNEIEGFLIDVHDFVDSEYMIVFTITSDVVDLFYLNKLVDELKPDLVTINMESDTLKFIYKIEDI